MCDVVIKMYVYQNSHISAYYQRLYHLLKVKIVAYDMVLWHKLKLQSPFSQNEFFS